MKLTALAVPLVASVGIAQELLYDLPYGSPEGAWRPGEVRGLSDLDGDGHSEFAIGTRVFSGLDGSLVFDATAAIGFSDPVSVDEMGDLDGDGVPDLIYGLLHQDFDAEAPMAAVSGADGSLLGKALPTGWLLGFDTLYWVRGGGDIDGDGVGDAIFSGFGVGFFIDGFWGYVSGATLSPQVVIAPPSDLDEAPPKNGVIFDDVNADGIQDVAYTRFFYPPTGYVVVDVPAYLQDTGSVWAQGVPGVQGLARAGDYDGDGCNDLACSIIVSGGPSYPTRPVIVSGQDLTPLFAPNVTAGHRVAGPGDVNGDGFLDLLTSDPYDASATPRAELLSGADGNTLWSTDDAALTIDAAGDINADGIADWIVGFDTHTQVWAGCEPEVTTYCTGKASSAGCTPSIDTAGLPTASGPDDFLVLARNALAQKPGLFFHGTTGALAVPFLGGTLCVAPPLQRGPVVFSNGPTDCESGYAFAFTQAYAAGFGILGGTTVHGQFWMRDPDQLDGTGVVLSNGVAFDWCL